MRPFSSVGYGSDFWNFGGCCYLCVRAVRQKKAFFNRDGDYICRIVRFEFWHFKSRILPHL